jgi:arylsulfatase A-like enzyme
MDAKSLTRRGLLKMAGVAAVGTAEIARAIGGKAERPNVVLIMTDDQGWGDIRSHGNDKIDTPVMDRLAASGARFDRFFVCPLCAPTRASLLTGRYHLRTGTHGVTGGKEIMRAEEVTVAEVLKRAGYVTGCFGKWHNGAYWPHHPNGQGFDEFYGFCAGHWNNYFDTTLDHNGKQVKTTGYITDVLTDAAIGFIRKNRSRPFFAYVPYNAPHSPFQVPDRYWGKYKTRGLDEKTASVYAMCENLDDNLGRILKSLDELKLAERTVVIFLTDNGPNGRRFNGGMAGTKGSNQEGGTRVPCFVRWPGHVMAGTVIRQIAAHVDLLPTIAAMAGVANPKTLPLDGVSLLPLLTATAGDWADRMLFERGAVRTQRWRLQMPRSGGRARPNAKPRAKLYDMVADPGQKKDVAADHPDVSEKLSKACRAWYADVSKGIEGMPPPLPVGYEQAPVVTLLAPECKMAGKVRFKQGRGWANDWITNWTSTDDSAAWELDVVRGGRYEVTLMYTCPPADVGSRVRVDAGSRHVEGVVAKAHDPKPIPSPDRVQRKEVHEKVWAPLVLGRIELLKGKTRLTVLALTKSGKQVFDLKAVRLRRVE